MTEISTAPVNHPWLAHMNEWVEWAVLRRLVENKLVGAYWSFWAWLLLRIRRPLIIGVTGSVGKTTTVAMIAHVLAHPATKGKLGVVGHTAQNMNDDSGLPLTVLRFRKWPRRRRELLAVLLLPFRTLVLALSPRYPQVLVLEFGTHARGHLHHLVKIAPPDIGVVTTIGPAHLDTLKNLRGVMQEKSAIVRTIPASGLVVLGTEHDFVADLEALSKGRVIKLPGRGEALSRNIARTIALHLGIPEQAIAAALADFQPAQHRLNKLHLDELTVIDDSYNANPLSMRLGLDTLTEIAKPGQRRLAMLGAMGELGEETARYHREIGLYAHQRADVVIGVGELAKHYGSEHWYSTSTECAEHLDELIRPDDCILVKGSASVRMSTVVDRMRAALHSPDTGTNPMLGLTDQPAHLNTAH
jgi:UDP-N-acetylmuramoyl-tripeptide--D-alanyl-D-alanine ligase